MKEMSKEEAIEYCFSNVTYSKLEKSKYHKYREYKRRHNNGQPLKDKAINSMLQDFGFIITCKYFLKGLNEEE